MEPEIKKRRNAKLILGILFAIIIFSGARVIVIVAGTIDYYRTEELCLDSVSPELVHFPKSQLPSTMIVYEVKPFVVITDRGNMYPGDEYVASGEGPWLGMATLLFSGRKGAHFVIKYPIIDPENGYMRKNCRGFLPIGVYD